MGEYTADTNNILYVMRELLDEDVTLKNVSLFGSFFTELHIAGRMVAWCKQDDFQVNRMVESFYNGLTYQYK